MSGLEIFFLIFLIMGLVAVIIWFALTKQDYDECQNSESAFCPKIVCGNDPSTTSASCSGTPGNTAYVPYRIDSAGHVICQSQPTATVIYK